MEVCRRSVLAVGTMGAGTAHLFPCGCHRRRLPVRAARGSGS